MGEMNTTYRTAETTGEVDDVYLPTFGVLVDLEMLIEAKKRRKLHDVRHALRTITEAFEHLEDVICAEVPNANDPKILLALVKTAAACCRAAEDRGLLAAHGMDLERALDREIGGGE